MINTVGPFRILYEVIMVANTSLHNPVRRNTSPGRTVPYRTQKY